MLNRLLRCFVLVSLVVTAALIGMSMLRVPWPRVSPPAGLEPTQIKSDLILTPADLVLGNPTARHKLVMFGDYQCQPCSGEWAALENRMRQGTEDLAVYFHNFPLTGIHPRALEAATFAEIAKSRGGFAKMHRMLYQLGLPKELTDYLRVLQLPTTVSPSERLACRKRVAEDFALGRELGVSATPSLFYVDQSGRVFRLQSLENLPKG
jgi:protein-disulfide isomerase